MERRLSDAEYDHQATIAESQRMQETLRYQIAEQSRQIQAERRLLQIERQRVPSNLHVPERDGNAASGIDDILRQLDDSTAASELSRISEERLSKSLAFVESLATKIRGAQDEIKDRKIKELELKERERKESSSEGSTCCICKDELKTILLLPCRHLCLCENCSRLPVVSNCPVCRTTITERLQVYS